MLTFHKLIFFWQNLNNVGNKIYLSWKMNIVELDTRGRLTLPSEIRSKVKAKKFIVVLEGDSMRLILLIETTKIKGLIHILGSIEELEEAGEQILLKRDAERQVSP